MSVEPSHLAKKVYETIRRKGWSSYVVVGKQGSGKTAYAYNSIKWAYAMMNEIDPKDLCFGYECEEPDPVDLELKKYVFATLEDVKRLAELIGRLDGEVLPFVLIDDIGISSLDYHAGGIWRKLYIAFKEFDRFRRAVARVVVWTTPYEEWIPKAILTKSVVVYASADRKRFTYRAYVRVPVPVRPWELKEYAGVYRLSKYVIPVWEDEIPRDPRYALPKWLERAIDERKRALLRKVFSRAVQSMEEEGL